MNNQIAFIKQCPRLMLALTLLLFVFGATKGVQAQEIDGDYLYSDGQTHTIEYGDLDAGKKYLEVKIPSSDSIDISFLELTAKGADGGFISGKSGNKDWHKTGEGATLTVRFTIGTGENELKPGSTLRFIIGEKGSNGSYAGGGGSGTGIAYLEEGTSTWKTLLIAGGAGGSGYDLDEWSQATNHPGRGADIYAYSWDTGLSTNKGGGGAVYSKDSNNEETGQSGYNSSSIPVGGSGGTKEVAGGDGFGGGGAGSGKVWHPANFFKHDNGYGGRGGGGGGYTGGAPGGTGDGGNPGTSYVKGSSKTTFLFGVNGGFTSNPQDGNIKYRLY